MKRKIIQFLLFLTLSLTFGCKSTQDRVRDFVEYYNNVAYDQFSAAFGRINNKVVARTYAEVIPGDTKITLNVKIVFVSKFALKDPAKDLYTKFILVAFSNFIAANKDAMNLIDHGVKFKVIYTSRTEKPISELIIDKAKLQELLKEKPGQELEIGKGNRNSTIRPEVKQMLITLNNSLPIVVDKQLQTKITKIDVNSLNELVYNIEVGKEMEEMLNGKDAKKLMKANIIANPNSSNLYNRMRNLGLSNIKYVYYTRSGKRLNDILITQEDFR